MKEFVEQSATEIQFDSRFFAALDEFQNDVRLLRKAYDAMLHAVPNYEPHFGVQLDPLIEIFALSCLDQCHAINSMLKTFKFIDLGQISKLMDQASSVRALKRHIAGFIGNYTNSAKSLYSGIYIWYGQQLPDRDYACRAILFDGAKLSGNVTPLNKGVERSQAWRTRKQIVYHIGKDRFVNLTILVEVIEDNLDGILNFLIGEANRVNDGSAIERLKMIILNNNEPNLSSFNYSVVFTI